VDCPPPIPRAEQTWLQKNRFSSKDREKDIVHLSKSGWSPGGEHGSSVCIKSTIQPYLSNLTQAKEEVTGQVEIPEHGLEA
jgi:hypothetical protein